MEPATAFEALATSLSGQSISYLWRGYGSAVSIEFGELTPRLNRDGSQGHPEGQISLSVEWSWRIENEVGILCGSWSEEEIWEPTFNLLRDARVSGVRLFGRLPEIEVITDEGVRFLSFSTTEGQPQWDIVDRRVVPANWFSIHQGRLFLGDGSEVAQ